MITAPTRDMTVIVTKSPKHDNPNHPVRNDFEADDLRPAVDELGSMVDEFRCRTYPWYHELGEVVRQHYSRVREERESMGRSMYGQRFFNRLAIELDRPNVSGQLLSGCFKLVEAYSEEKYRKLCQHDAITPTHAMMLARIEGDERAKLEKKVVSERLTTKQLFEAEKEMFGIRRKPGGGRKPKIPKNLKEAFVHLTAQAEQFVKHNNECWFCDEYDIVSVIKDLPADKLTDKFKEQVIEAAEHCDNLATTATRDAQALRGTLPNIERRMKAQAEFMARRKVEEEE